MPYNVEIKNVEAQHAAVVKVTAGVAEMGEKIGAAYITVSEYLAKSGQQISGPAIGYYKQVGDNCFEVCAGFVVAQPIEGEGEGGVTAFELPAIRIATTIHVGPYETLPEAYGALLDRAKALGEEIDLHAPMWEEYLSDPETPPEQTQTVVCWPVKQGK